MKADLGADADELHNVLVVEVAHDLRLLDELLLELFRVFFEISFLHSDERRDSVVFVIGAVHISKLTLFKARIYVENKKQAQGQISQSSKSRQVTRQGLYFGQEGRTRFGDKKYNL